MSPRILGHMGLHVAPKCDDGLELFSPTVIK